MVETIFNGCEALLWLVFAAVVAVRFRNSAGRLRRTSRAMAVFFVLFSASDVIEMQTGAWWRPLGLLLFKGVCLIGLLWCFAALIRGERTAASAGESADKHD